jgi:AraC-like DNA-binding protein
MSDTPRRRGRGGQGGHEPRTRIRTRELRALELTNLGWSQHQIAAELGISQAGVSKLLKRIELRILRELTETVERQKARHTLRLEHLFAESMRAWIDSKADSTRRRQRKTQPGTGTGATIAEIVTENQYGDPRYLEEARKALADHRKIWGLDAPQKVDVRASRNPYADMTEAELRAELARQARLLGAPDSPTPTANRSTEPSTPARQEPAHADPE